jgi:hypothetical protein
LLGVLTARALLGLGLAALGRWILGGLALIDAADAGALAAAAVVAATSAWFAARLAPDSWMWNGAGLTPVVAAWASRHLGLEARADGGRSLPEAGPTLATLDATVARLATLEIASGVSQAQARRAAVESAAAALTHRRAVRVGRLRDALPLVELAAIGLPGLLMLLVPALQMAGSSLGRP